MNSLFSKLARTSQMIDTFSEWTGRMVAWLTLLMVLITFLVVILRYAFSMGWIAMQESITYLYALVFLLGTAYTLKHDGHVRVDIFYRTMRPKAKALVNLCGILLLLLPTCVFLFWVSWDYVADSWSVRESSREAGGLPGVFLLKTVILVMTALIFLQGISDLLRSVLILCGETPPRED
jgi:TRAP-type mannitol/chloroaromatic compound transport system permease small subunit